VRGAGGWRVWLMRGSPRRRSPVCARSLWLRVCLCAVCLAGVHPAPAAATGASDYSTE